MSRHAVIKRAKIKRTRPEEIFKRMLLGFGFRRYPSKTSRVQLFKNQAQVKFVFGESSKDFEDQVAKAFEGLTKNGVIE